LGVNRPGTSALTRVLSLCGGTLPAGLVGANAGNPSGYWEPRASHWINYTILRRHGSEWFDPTLRLQEEGEFDAAENTACGIQSSLTGALECFVVESQSAGLERHARPAARVRRVHQPP
jgi:hypothetical protein